MRARTSRRQPSGGSVCGARSTPATLVCTTGGSSSLNLWGATLFLVPCRASTAAVAATAAAAPPPAAFPFAGPSDMSFGDATPRALVLKWGEEGGWREGGLLIFRGAYKKYLNPSSPPPPAAAPKICILVQNTKGYRVSTGGLPRFEHCTPCIAREGSAPTPWTRGSSTLLARGGGYTPRVGAVRDVSFSVIAVSFLFVNL